MALCVQNLAVADHVQQVVAHHRDFLYRVIRAWNSGHKIQAVSDHRDHKKAVLTVHLVGKVVIHVAQLWLSNETLDHKRMIMGSERNSYFAIHDLFGSSIHFTHLEGEMEGAPGKGLHRGGSRML